MTIRDQFHGDFDKFLPWMLGSQTCEKTFHIVRSMSSTFSTVLNFSILGLLRRMHQLTSNLLYKLIHKVLYDFQVWKNTAVKKERISCEIKDEDIAEAVQSQK